MAENNDNQNNNDNQGGGDDQNNSGSMLDANKIISDAQGGDGTGEDQPNKVVANEGEGDPPKNPDHVDKPGDKQARPEWLKDDKFWDAEKGEIRLEAMHKSFRELESKFHKGDHKAPEKAEDYKINIDDTKKELLFGKDATPDQMKNDPIFKQATAWAAKNKIPQAAMDEFIDLYAGIVEPEMAKVTIDVGAEKAKLGKNATAIIANQDQFFTQIFKAGYINEDSLKEAQILFETAAGIKLMQGVRAFYGETKIPTDADLTGTGLPSRDELARMSSDPKYGVDKTYTADVDAKYAKVYGSQPAMSSIRDK